MNIQTLSKQLKQKWEKLPPLLKGTAILTNKKGNTRFCIHIDNIDKDEGYIDLSTNLEQLTCLLHSENLKSLAERETDIKDADLFRYGIRIYFKHGKTLQPFERQSLKNNGIKVTKNGINVIPLFSTYLTFDESLMNATIRHDTERYLEILLFENNFDTIVQAIITDYDEENTAPQIIYNQRTKVCDFQGNYMTLPNLSELKRWDNFTPENTIDLEFTDFEKHRMLRDFKKFDPVSTEIAIGFLPNVFYLEQQVPERLLLQISLEENLHFTDFDFRNNFLYKKSICEQLIEQCRSHKLRPNIIFVKGPFADYVKNHLSSFAELLKISIVVVEELEYLDSFRDSLEDEQYQFIDSLSDQLLFEDVLNRLSSLPDIVRVPLLNRMQTDKLTDADKRLLSGFVEDSLKHFSLTDE